MWPQSTCERGCIPLTLFLDRKLGLAANIERDTLQGSCSSNHLTTVAGVPAPRIAPGDAGRQIDLTLANPRGQHRSDQQIRTEKKLIVDLPGRLVLGKLQEERAQQWDSFLAGELHLLQNVRAQTCTQEEQIR